MKEKKTFKERCIEAKEWLSERKTPILAGIGIFLTGTIVGIIKGVDVGFDTGYNIGHRDTINNICNRLEDPAEPIMFKNHETGKILCIGKVDAPEKESEEA